MKTIIDNTPGNRSSMLPPTQSVNHLPRHRRNIGQMAFSLVELMVVVMVISVLASVGVATLWNTQRTSRQIALEGDAKTLNRAVQGYLVSGGMLTGVTQPTEVLAKLKTKPLAEQAGKIAGLKGPFVDMRLELRPAAPADEWSLVYDPTSSTFSVTNGNSGLVTNVNEALASQPVALENRHVSLALATADPWVWDYAKQSAVDRTAPTRPGVASVGTTRPGNQSAGEKAWPLTPPAFSRRGGALGPNDYPATIGLQDYNPQANSELYYRINGGEWSKYSGGISLPLVANTKIESYASPRNTNWEPSGIVTETFTFTPGQLAAPTITPATGSFQYDNFPKTLTLQNTNPSGSSVMQYRIGSGEWTNYSAPVSLTPETSVVVYARALPIDSQRWVGSSEATAMYDLTQQTLQSPVFTKAAGSYPATDYPLTVALTNPNPSGSSTLEYREKNGTWQPYTTPITLNYDRMDVTFEARAVAVDPKKWLTSTTRQSRYQLTPSQLKPPVVTPPGGYYPYGSFPTVATIANPNPVNTSEIWYRFGTTGAFIKYNPASPPALSKDNYQTTLTAYIKSLKTPQFTDSAAVQEIYETIYFVASTQGLFHDPVPDKNGNSNNLVTNLPSPKEGALFKWGKIQGANGLTQSTMQFDGAPTAKVAPGDWFFLGKLTYYNGTIISGTGAGGVNLKFGFNMTQPSATSTSADYTLKLINTPNTGTNEQNADYVYLPTLGVPFTTTVGGRKFKLDVRFGETTANGFGNVSEFHIFEGTSATGSMYGRITEVP